MVAVISIAATEERKPVEVRRGGGQGDGGALAPVDIRPVREPPTVLQMGNRAQCYLLKIDALPMITDNSDVRWISATSKWMRRAPRLFKDFNTEATESARTLTYRNCYPRGGRIGAAGRRPFAGQDGTT